MVNIIKALQSLSEFQVKGPIYTLLKLVVYLHLRSYQVNLDPCVWLILEPVKVSSVNIKQCSIL